MELLLNLVWVGMGMVIFTVLLTHRDRWRSISRVPYVTALLALTCTLVLLFPVVSVSDDLHPSQLMVEDASKRSQHLASFLGLAHQQPLDGCTAALLLICLFAIQMASHWRQPRLQQAHEMLRARTPRAGRAPPSLHPALPYSSVTE